VRGCGDVQPVNAGSRATNLGRESARRLKVRKVTPPLVGNYLAYLPTYLPIHLIISPTIYYLAKPQAKRTGNGADRIGRDKEVDVEFG